MGRGMRGARERGGRGEESRDERNRDNGRKRKEIGLLLARCGDVRYATIPVLGQLKRECHRFEASLDYIVRSLSERGAGKREGGGGGEESRHIKKPSKDIFKTHM